MGRPATGKSTTAKLFYDKISKTKRCFLIDADDLSKYEIMPNIGNFNLESRLIRAKFLVKLINWLSNYFEYIIIAAIGQPKDARKIWKKEIKKSFFIYLKSDFNTCKERDFKGIYNLKNNVIGKDIPFDEPLESDLIIINDNLTPKNVLDKLLKKKIL